MFLSLNNEPLLGMYALGFNPLMGISPACEGKKQRKRTPRRVLRLKMKQRKAAKKKNR